MMVPINKSISISKPKLLIVEGSHERKFFGRLLSLMDLPDVQIEEVGGNVFRPIISGLPGLENYDNLVSIGITRDADIDFNNMFVSVQNSLNLAKLPAPNKPCEFVGEKPRISIYIFPDNESPGSLENLCIASVEDDPILGCVDGYFDCLQKIQGAKHPHLYKAKVQVYCAKEPEGNLHMGIASEKNVWRWESPVFDSVKEFLTSL